MPKISPSVLLASKINLMPVTLTQHVGRAIPAYKTYLPILWQESSARHENLLQLAKDCKDILTEMMQQAADRPFLTASEQESLYHRLDIARTEYLEKLEHFSDLCYLTMNTIDRDALDDDIKKYNKMFDETFTHLVYAIAINSPAIMAKTMPRERPSSARPSSTRATAQSERMFSPKNMTGEQEESFELMTPKKMLGISTKKAPSSPPPARMTEAGLTAGYGNHMYDRLSLPLNPKPPTPSSNRSGISTAQVSPTSSRSNDSRDGDLGITLSMGFNGKIDAKRTKAPAPSAPPPAGLKRPKTAPAHRNLEDEPIGAPLQEKFKEKPKTKKEAPGLDDRVLEVQPVLKQKSKPSIPRPEGPPPGLEDRGLEIQPPLKQKPKPPIPRPEGPPPGYIGPPLIPLVPLHNKGLTSQASATVYVTDELPEVRKRHY